MEPIRFYEIDEKYITYLAQFAPHIFLNQKPGIHNERKYIGILFQIGEFQYFAPLSSFKDKHNKMQEGIDFIKVKDYAVINLNNMFPAPPKTTKCVNFALQKDPQYRALLMAEYRYIKSIQNVIRKKALTLYSIKIRDGESTALCRRCNDFKRLEEVSLKYIR